MGFVGLFLIAVMFCTAEEAGPEGFVDWARAMCDAIYAKRHLIGAAVTWAHFLLLPEAFSREVKV